MRPSTPGSRPRTRARQPAVPRRLKWLVCAALLGRLHSTTSSVVIGLTIQRWTGSFALAGVAIGSLVVGQGLSGPPRGRAVDRSAVRTLVVCGSCYPAGLAAVALMTLLVEPSTWPTVVVLLLVTGLVLPPVSPALRSAIPDLVRDDAEASRVLSWEATYQELIFIAGPPLAVGVAAVAGPPWALLLVALSAGAGALSFAAVLRRSGTHMHPGSAADAGREPTAATDPVVTAGVAAGRRTLVKLAVSYGLLLGSLSAMTLVGVRISVAAGHPGVAGILEAMIAVGSMSGGALASRGALDALSLAMRMVCMSLALVALTLVGWLVPSLPLVGVVMAAAGFWVAPTLARHSLTTLSLSAPDRRGAVLGWVGGAGLGINAVMTPVTGSLLDRLGAGGGAALAVVAMAGAARVVAGLPTPAARRSGDGRGDGRSTGSRPGSVSGSARAWRGRRAPTDRAESDDDVPHCPLPGPTGSCDPDGATRSGTDLTGTTGSPRARGAAVVVPGRREA